MPEGPGIYPSNRQCVGIDTSAPLNDECCCSRSDLVFGTYCFLCCGFCGLFRNPDTFILVTSKHARLFYTLFAFGVLASGLWCLITLPKYVCPEGYESWPNDCEKVTYRPNNTTRI